MDSDQNLGEYIDTLTDANGVSVVTVSDGWVFTLSVRTLRQLLEAAEKVESKKTVLFVQSSANKPTN